MSITDITTKLSVRLIMTGILSSMILLAGCNSVRPQLPEAATLSSVRGVLQRVEQTLWFKPCYERLWWPVGDYTVNGELPEIYQRLAGTGAQPLYIEADAAVDPAQDHRLLIAQLHIAGGTAATCGYRIDGVQFRAASVSPYWIADIDAESVVVKSTNPLGRYSFLVASENDATGVIYRERTEADKPFSIRLIAQRCEESSNGTLFNYRAEMVLFGHRYRGCARQGHVAGASLQGYYWFSPGGTDQVVMNLGEDQRAQLVYRESARRVVTVRGRWQFLQSGKLILSMKKPTGEEFLVLFRRQEDGVFRLQGSEFDWAPAQADFQHWQPSGLPGGRLLPSERATPQLSDPEDSADTEPMPVITVPAFNPAEAEPNGDQLTPITVTECELNAATEAC